MNILGLYPGHDGNCALVMDGKVIAHHESERFTRIKRQLGLHGTAIFSMLNRANIGLDDIDAIVMGGGYCTCGNWLQEQGQDTGLTKRLEPVVKSAALGTHMERGPYPYQVDAGDLIVQRDFALTPSKTIPLVIVPHHLSHGSLAYYTGPYLDANIMTWDGGGDNAFGMAACGHDNKIINCRFNPPDWKEARTSMGGPWTEISRMFNGLDNGIDTEGKIMGLAAYGQPRERVKLLIRNYMVDYWPEKATRPHVMALKTELANDWDPCSQMAQDTAASLQCVTEELMIDMLRDAGFSVDIPVCLAGGCAYNCVANSKIRQLFPVHVAHCPHDGGLALGAALFYWYHMLDNAFEGCKEFSPYLGSGQDYDIDGADIDQAIDDLVLGRVIAWFAGRSESGKRALGHRSLLADPRLPYIKGHINERIKHREWYRPFAPSVLANHVEWSEMRPDQTCSPYMSFSFPVKKEWQNRIAGIVHCDGSSRAQTVTGINDEMYIKLLKDFYMETGIPMVLNTSLNVSTPIVDTKEQAESLYETCQGIDALYVDGKCHARRY